MRQTNQQFTKGINERFPEERQTPERLSKLQNARLFQRGDGVFVSRIDGFEEWLSYEGSDYTVVLDQQAKEGNHDTSGYKKGYRIGFEEVIHIFDENSLQAIDGITHFLSLGENFFIKIIRFQNYLDSVGVGENFVVRGIPVLSFVDGVEVEELFRVFNGFTLSFTEAVDVIDRDLSCLE